MKTILIALGALALMPAAAQATTVGYASDGALVVTAAPGERNQVSLQEDDGDAGKVVVYEGGTGVHISGPCQAYDYTQVCAVGPVAAARSQARMWRKPRPTAPHFCWTHPTTR